MHAAGGGRAAACDGWPPERPVLLNRQTFFRIGREQWESQAVLTRQDHARIGRRRTGRNWPRLPGSRLPGSRLPGSRLPGSRLPGLRLPGPRLLGLRSALAGRVACEAPLEWWRRRGPRPGKFLAEACNLGSHPAYRSQHRVAWRPTLELGQYPVRLRLDLPQTRVDEVPGVRNPLEGTPRLEEAVGDRLGA